MAVVQKGGKKSAKAPIGNNRVKKLAAIKSGKKADGKVKINKKRPMAKSKKPNGPKGKVIVGMKGKGKNSKIVIQKGDGEEVEDKLTVNVSKPHVVSAGSLKWKPVEIPDTLGDYDGFYGLEEIDGVDVKIVNGQVQFVVKDEEKVGEAEKFDPTEGIEFEGENDNEEEETDKKKNNKKERKAKQKVEKTKVEKETSDDEEEVEEISADDEQNEEDEKESKIEKDEDEEEEEADEDDDDLAEGGFDTLKEVLDEDITLPNWDMELSKYIVQGLSHLGFTSPTLIQKLAIPLALDGKDIVGKAITGSGKTLAYGIPILNNALAKLSATENVKENKLLKVPAGLIFAPTRELATQVVKHLKKLIEYSPFNENTVVSLTGGLSIQKQERLLFHNPQIIVATPGRCLELIEKDNNIATQLASIDTMVFDEADRLLQDGHFEEVDKILEILQNFRPSEVKHKKYQSLVFSATFSKELFGKLDKKPPSNSNNKNKKKGKKNNNKRKVEEVEEMDATVQEVMDILGKKLKFRSKPSFIDANPTELVANKITEAMIPCMPTERDLYLYYFLLMFPGTTLVFTNSKDSVKRLAPLLNALNVPTVSLHSSMIQKQRLRSLERFNENCTKAIKNKTSSVLIASDVAARGLDIPNIQHVVHYHLPRSADLYVHRSGRTARAGKEGVSIVMCSPQEASGPLRKLRRIINKTEKIDDLKTLPIEVDILGQCKERIQLASEIADAEVSSQTTNKENSWVSKAAEELGIDDLSDLEEDDFLKRDRKRKEGKMLDAKDLKFRRKELKMMLTHPIRKSGRRSYIAGGLTNLAELLMRDDQTNKLVIGSSEKDALTTLKSEGKRKRQKK
ncbi:organic cyclic compound binding protein [[Candida] boidinii]|nr:organic cyclic compound binding protein [[Candida] boidinii]